MATALLRISSRIDDSVLFAKVDSQRAAFKHLVEEALAQAVETEIEGVRTRVMAAEHLAAIALQTGRATDAARLLQFIESGALDPDRLDAILQRHGLVAKWDEFSDKFKSNE